MLFNSREFIFFFAAVVGLYYLIPARARNLLLLICSYYFYMCWKAEYAVLILASTLVDYYVALRIEGSETPGQRRALLGLSLGTNLGILFAFKYANFFAESARSLLTDFNIFWNIPTFDLLLPVGISFYTFQTLSYSIDVYKGDLKPEKSFINFALYVSFFPQLVAGPIERASRLLPQFRKEQSPTFSSMISGGQLMLWGLFKKVVVADRLAAVVDYVYSAHGTAGGLTLLFATYCFSFQIYCDFSGYSDVAIGAARILGYDLMENFRRPYFSKSLGEFWRRWHISLSTWFRDYLYLPLGGNRVSKVRGGVNILIVFLVSGLWHGANWTFVIWGLIHGVWLLLERQFKPLLDAMKQRMPGLSSLVLGFVTFHIVVISWVFFRAETIGKAVVIVGSILGDLASGAFSVGDSLASLGLNSIEATICLAGLSLLLLKDFLEEGSDRRTGILP